MFLDILSMCQVCDYMTFSFLRSISMNLFHTLFGQVPLLFTILPRFTYCSKTNIGPWFVARKRHFLRKQKTAQNSLALYYRINANCCACFPWNNAKHFWFYRDMCTSQIIMQINTDKCYYFNCANIITRSGNWTLNEDAAQHLAHSAAWLDRPRLAIN